MDNEKSDPNALPVPSRRIARFGRLSAMTAGVAGNMALGGIAQLGQGKRPKMRDLLLTPRNVGRVADQLAQMRGAAMKIGQLMSMDAGEVLPPELADILARLRDNAHQMPGAQLKQVLSRQWPENWLRSFAKFDVRPIAAASIGQVHRAQLKDGRDLAIKVQYPGVAQSIDSDVANVGTLMRMSGMMPKGFELAPYLEEGRKQLHEETDYIRESQSLARFGALLADDPDFTVPALVPEWSGPEILAMTYLSGTPIEKTLGLPQAERDRIAERLITLTLRELFEFGFMQTDPNFANYMYNAESGKIVLLDFGATREITPEVATQYHKLMQAGLARDETALHEVCSDIGFFGPDTKETHRAQVVAMIGMMFDAIEATALVDFSDTTLSQQLQDAGMALAEDGFVPPPLPIDVLLLQRKFGGVFLLANRLRAKVDVISLLRAHL